jgi:hypothetical protein
MVTAFGASAPGQWEAQAAQLAVTLRQ